MERRISRCVFVGGLSVGGEATVSIQSMTNTATSDVEATVAQILRLEAAGCEIVRASVPDMASAKAFRAIRDAIHIPLVADIHFDYRLAIAAMENGADKIRYNPGNIGSEAKIAEFAACAKLHRVPVRVGVNGGSLEKSLLAKYGGPTAEALAESALSGAEILERAGIEDIVLSLKASSVAVTVAAARLAAARCDLPLHLGVTEAGTYYDSIVKSSMGIGALLIDGIGDTIRVSVTGDPVQEVEAAKQILSAAGVRRFSPEIISCPTCARCKTDTMAVIESIRTALPPSAPPIRIAVMGCAVNGPGEAREADIGIAFGTDNAVVFRCGEIVYSGEKEAVISRLLKEIATMGEENS